MSYCKLGYNNSLTHCYVRQSVYTKLLSVLSNLDDSYSLLIYDTLRTVASQQSLYDHCRAILEDKYPDYSPKQILDMVDNFVASPTVNLISPSPHMTGGAIDLTLCKDGVPLEMGTHFDEFSNKSYTNYYEENPCNDSDIIYRNNRRLLYNLMINAGFENYSHEWWHFAYGERLWSKKTGNAPVYGYFDPHMSNVLLI